MSRGAIVLLVLAMAAVALMCSAALAADRWVVTQDGFNVLETEITTHGWGGEFQVYTDWTGYFDPSGHTAGYTTGGPGDMKFATFCLNSNKEIHWGTTYHFDDAQDLLAPANGAIAYLYDRFYSGTLYQYAYSDNALGDTNNEDSQRAKDAQQLQRMFWQLSESGHGWNWAPSADPIQNKYYVWWDTAQDYMTADVDGVKVMRLSGDTQDLMTLVWDAEHVQPPIPEPGTIALLATGGLGLLPLLRRRRTT